MSSHSAAPIWLTRADLRRAYLELEFLTATHLMGADLAGADLTDMDHRPAVLIGAYFNGANLSGLDLSHMDLRHANFTAADLSGANVTGANLRRAHLRTADLSGAKLSNSDLKEASLVATKLDGARLDGCQVYGVSAWDVSVDAKTSQRDLVITRKREDMVTGDDLKVAQFIYLLLENEEIRHVIDTITSKLVLILGRFIEERKKVLDALRNKLRKLDYTPVLVDFDKPASRDLTETVSTLAHMARFVIADITDAKNIPQELQKIVPTLSSLAVRPIIL
jgi:uncharacterized protein YjbI with pentapeptide repeats